ncbi:MAG: phosphoglycerate kinase [Patescibacteria group bacterium]
MLQLPLIAEHADLAGKRVLLRADFNVPLEAGRVRDAYKIERSIPTIDFLRKAGARVIVMSHLGNGKTSDTLSPVAKYLYKKFPLTFLDRLMSPENARIVNAMQNGDVVLLENLRHNDGEEKNNQEFTQHLASFGDVYVNDAFAVSHRVHASIIGIPTLLPSYAGLLLAEEVKQLSVAFSPKHPFLFILGGAKLSTKMPLLKKFLNTADHVFVGGIAANDFLKASGYEVGRSVVDLSELDGIKDYGTHERLILPSDVVIKNEAGSAVCGADGVARGDAIVDVGPGTIHNLEETVVKAALVVWNGPLGYYEAGFTDGTRELLSLVANAQAISIIGGGDTVAVAAEMGFLDRFSFVSTGGGAMLDFLSNETLPGIDALIKK